MTREAAGAFDEEDRGACVARGLTPETTRVFWGPLSLLQCEVEGDTLYVGVFATRLFPATYPDRYISLRHTDREGRAHEIGIIGDLNDFPAEAQRLIRASLDRYYHEQFITRVHKVRYRHDLLSFDVETQRGRERFSMRWEYDRAQDHGPSGKVLLDVDENRYVIPDLSALPPRDRRRVTRFIYW